ncbi:MAG: response regulator transcription factor [Lachnospiraceae bacterium]|nr:response regulator transcription factor [Lachnospiraceae bacterium]
MANILVCDDEADIVNAVRIYLEADGNRVVTASDGAEAVACLQKEDVQLVVMDVMMPVMDGVQALVKIREFSNVPVILLTAKSEDADKVLGLDLGADDYVTKPFTPLELLARVRSQLRRYMRLGSAAPAPEGLTVGELCLNDETKQVTVSGEPVHLTPTEYAILKLLMEHPGRVYSSRAIYSGIWKESVQGNENSVAVHIRHLREKLEIDPTSPRYIQVVWGQGYRLGEGI